MEAEQPGQSHWLHELKAQAHCVTQPASAVCASSYAPHYGLRMLSASLHCCQVPQAALKFGVDYTLAEQVGLIPW